MKKELYCWLMAALLCGLGMSVSSCKDDNKEPSEEEKQRQAEEEADKDMADAATFWSVVGQLTDTTMPDDWRNATYEPSIGQPDGTNTAVRIISAADAESAAERFSNLVGADITESTQDYTYQNDVVGTLTYHKTGGSSLATVDVSIKQMPGLSQIIYKSPEQIGDNSSFKGTAYYRFGDVVQKQNADGQWDYWICVRPCFGPDSKTDSHWISLSKIPSANVKSTTKNGKTYVMPKSLGTSKDHMQNLAELLYAMLNPTQWATNLRTNDGYKTLKFFRDFNYQKNYKYHNEAFFRNVGNGMPDELFKEIFGLTKNEMRTELQQWGLHLIHGSATMSGNDITLDMAEFNGMNLKTQRTYKSTSRWDTTPFNIYDLTRNHYIDNTTLTANRGKIWVCRYASGTTLAKGSAENPVFDKYKRLPNCRDVFVYNADVDNLDMDDLKNIEPREANATADDPSVASNALTDGSGIYMIGDVVKDEQGNRWFCIAGSAYSSDFFFVTDRTAWFVSFDFNGIDTSGPVVQGLPTEEDMPQLALLFNSFWFVLQSNKDQHHYHPYRESVSDCVIPKHIRDYADVDLTKICIGVDSIWRFTDNKGITYDSYSGSVITNIAYNDGNTSKQAICRIITDNTQAGSHRTACTAKSGTKFDNMLARAYTRYEHYDASKIRAQTPDEAGLGMTKWNLPWVMTDEKMYLQDVASQDMVNRHAKDDKWVTLPMSIKDGRGTTRRQPRTSAEASARPADYIGKYAPGAIPKTNIFNEPVAFLRVMKVTDNGAQNGNKKPNLVSQDGRQLTVVHLQNDELAYSQGVQCNWGGPYCAETYQGLYTFNNQTCYLPVIGGWETIYPPK